MVRSLLGSVDFAEEIRRKSKVVSSILLLVVLFLIFLVSCGGDEKRKGGEGVRVSYELPDEVKQDIAKVEGEGKKVNAVITARLITGRIVTARGSRISFKGSDVGDGEAKTITFTADIEDGKLIFSLPEAEGEWEISITVQVIEGEAGGEVQGQPIAEIKLSVQVSAGMTFLNLNESGRDIVVRRDFDGDGIPNVDEVLAGCNVFSREELINGQDDDCDGEVDEGLAPSGLTYTSVFTDTVSLRWEDNSRDEEEFIVEVSENPDFSVVREVSFPADTTEGDITGLQEGRTYWFRVYARSGTISTGYSNSISVTTMSIYFGTVAQVALGGAHTCAVKEDGSLWCWGANASGQLGVGDLIDRNIPVQVMSGGVKEVSLGTYYTCAVKEDGSLWCWGDNRYGQLGVGDFNDKDVPAQVMNEGISNVVLGAAHTCAIKKDGSLWCWGNNNWGQLGLGDTANRNTPFQVISDGVKQVALGDGHTCALKEDGSLWCWGRNNYGQLGLGDFTDRYTPVQVTSGGIKQIDAWGFNTCAIKEDNSLWCWGFNERGQLGLGDLNDRNIPIQVMESGVEQISLGYEHTCSVMEDSSLWCWGRNDYGQLGLGDFTDRYTPVRVISEGVERVSLRPLHSCVIKKDKSLWCWGRNNDGQLGLGYMSEGESMPSQVLNGTTK